MPTEVLCALLTHVVEVKGLNTSNTNFRHKPVVLLGSVFLLRGSIYLLDLWYVGHFHYVYHHLEGWMDLLQKVVI